MIKKKYSNLLVVQYCNYYCINKYFIGTVITFTVTILWNVLQQLDSKLLPASYCTFHSFVVTVDHIRLQSIYNFAILIVYSVHACSACLSVQGEGSIPLSKVYSIFDLLNWNLFLRMVIVW